ncbi:MAG: hypothetical protein ACP5OR_07165 [Candidatus Dormibacteria bacterium]
MTSLQPQSDHDDPEIEPTAMSEMDNPVETDTPQAAQTEEDESTVALRRRTSRKGRQSIVFSVPDLPPIRRPRGLDHLDRTPQIPSPDHKHLPGWTKRLHSQAAPILADIAGHLDGEAQEIFLGQVNRVVSMISEGKFSQARLYAKLIDDGYKQVSTFRKTQEKSARQTMAISTLRKRLTDDVRALQGRVGQDAFSKVQQDLRQANTRDELHELQQEVTRLQSEVQQVESKRRDREIARTRERIMHVAGGTKSRSSAAVVQESGGWQAMLKQFAVENGIVSEDGSDSTDSK